MNSKQTGCWLQVIGSVLGSVTATDVRSFSPNWCMLRPWHMCVRDDIKVRDTFYHNMTCICTSCFLNPRDMGCAPLYSLAPFPAAQWVALRGVPVGNLSSQTLGPIERSSLTVLVLIDAGISMIENKLFARFPHLRSVHLDHNTLSQLKRASFSGMNTSHPSLTYLSFSHNCIVELEPGCFEDVSRLTMLDLSHNLLSEVASEWFRGLSFLHTLILSRNKIEIVSATAFDSLHDLRVLNVSHNPLTCLSERTLSGLSLQTFSAGEGRVISWEQDDEMNWSLTVDKINFPWRIQRVRMRIDNFALKKPENKNWRLANLCPEAWTRHDGMALVLEGNVGLQLVGMRKTEISETSGSDGHEAGPGSLPPSFFQAAGAGPYSECPDSKFTTDNPNKESNTTSTDSTSQTADYATGYLENSTEDTSDGLQAQTYQECRSECTSCPGPGAQLPSACNAAYWQFYVHNIESNFGSTLSPGAQLPSACNAAYQQFYVHNIESNFGSPSALVHSCRQPKCRCKGTRYCFKTGVTQCSSVVTKRIIATNQGSGQDLDNPGIPDTVTDEEESRAHRRFSTVSIHSYEEVKDEDVYNPTRTHTYSEIRDEEVRDTSANVVRVQNRKRNNASQTGAPNIASRTRGNRPCIDVTDLTSNPIYCEIDDDDVYNPSSTHFYTEIKDETVAVFSAQDVRANVSGEQSKDEENSGQSLEATLIPLSVPVGLYAFAKLNPEKTTAYAKPVFLWLCAKLKTFHQERFCVLKEDVFSGLKKQDGRNLQVLEIGPGKGANFEYFPPRTSVIAVDPNIEFAQELEENSKQYPDVKVTKFVVAGAEDMSAVAEGSVDAVVCTLALCSVQDVDAVLGEVKRVLKPGGKFYYFEHVRHPSRTRTQYLQQLFNPVFYSLGAAVTSPGR
ncbi:regulation of response to stimulus, partial [Branchiostoma belcheri]